MLEELREGGFTLGGEQSGHVVMPAHATTGDGLLTAMRLMSRVATTGRPLAELAAVMTRLPQVLVNVKVADKAAVATSTSVSDAVAEVRPNWARPAGSCSARRAPSSWSASWSRPRHTRWPKLRHNAWSA